MRFHPRVPSAGRVVLCLLAGGIVIGRVASVRAADVEGEVAIPPSGVEEPEQDVKGFVPGVKTPLAPVAPLDPLPDCFVYLEGGPADPKAQKPQSTRLALRRSAFDPRILPVVAGSTVEFKNDGKKTHTVITQPAGLFGG